MSTGAGSTKHYLFGVKIYLDTVETQNANIGLYTRAFGGSNSQFDITNPSSTTMRYTYDGTGTAPLFVSNDMKIGDAILINSTNFNAANNGTFRIVAVAETYFEIDNSAGVVESNKTLGSATALQGSSRFRWIQATTANTTDTWSANILTEGGIGKDTRSADFRRSGGAAKINDMEISITNIVDVSGVITQVWQILNNAGIYFAGLKCEVIKVNLDVAHAGTRANETVRFTGICESPTGWDETKFIIPVKNAYYKRRSNLSTTIDPNDSDFAYAEDESKGKTVPLSFGRFKAYNITPSINPATGILEFIPALTRKAKVLRSSKKETVWNTGMFLNSIQPSKNATCYPMGMDAFPISYIEGSTDADIINARTFRFKYCEATPVTPDSDGKMTAILSWIVSTWATSTPRFQYIKIISGAGSGQYRKITALALQSANSVNIEFTVKDYLKTPLNHYYHDETTPFALHQRPSTATTSTQSWVQLVDIQMEYKCDIWPCFGFTDWAGNVLSATKELELYSHVQDSSADDTTGSVIEKPKEFLRLPYYAITAKASANSNTVIVNPKMFSNSIDNLVGFTLLPFAKVTAWGNGYYDTAAVSNRNRNSAITFPARKGINTIRIECYPPELPSGVIVHNVFFGIRVDNPSVAAWLQLWLYGKLRTADYTLTSRINSIRCRGFDCIPDFYYTLNTPDTDNKNFYVDYKPGAGDAIGTLTGYINYPSSSGITSKESYKKVERFSLVYWFDNANDDVGIFLRQLCLIIETNINIKDAIFTYHSGRVFDSTWGGRKTATDMIEKPQDVFEHVCRLLNWSENGEAKNWGKEYATTPNINTAATEGGFDWLGLSHLTSQKPNKQILDYDESWSDAIIESLCKQYRLCWFQNNAGQECIGSIETVDPSLVTVNVTLAEIIDGSIGDISEIGSEDIFCEPLVRFNYNAATEKFDNCLQITHADATTYVEGYVTGYAGASAEEMWNKAHALYQYYRTTEKPPSDLTDCYWISDLADVEKYVMHWFEWMGVYRSSDDAAGVYRVSPKKRISFSVPYEIGEEWFISMHFNLSLPHQTNGAAVQCIVEKLVFDYEQNRIEVSAIIVDETNKVSFYIQDSYDSFEAMGWHDWQDSFLTQAEAPSQSYDIQDAT